MNFIQRSLEIKCLYCYLKVIFLIGGITLIATGIKIRKQSNLQLYLA